MNYVELVIGGETYKLRLPIKNCAQLEKQLGCNPVQLLWNIDENILPKVSEIAILLQSMLSTYNHGITLEKTFELLEQYVAEGHKLFDLMEVFVQVFRECGLIGKVEENE